MVHKRKPYNLLAEMRFIPIHVTQLIFCLNGDLDWGVGLGIGDRDLGFGLVLGIRDYDWGFGIMVGHWDW